MYPHALVAASAPDSPTVQCTVLCRLYVSRRVHCSLDRVREYVRCGRVPCVCERAIVERLRCVETRVYGYGQRQRATGWAGGGVPSCIVAQLNCNARLRYHRQATFWKYAGKVQLKIHLQRCAMYVECALPVVCALSTVWSHYTHSHDTHDAVDA
jgi:hypothetical protein